MWLLDLKTVPDPVTAKRLLALESYSDAEAALAMTTLRVARRQPSLQPPSLRRLVAAVLLHVGPQHIELIDFDDADGEPALLLGLEAELARAEAAVWGWDSTQQNRSQLLTRALANGLALPRLLAESGPHSLASHYGFSTGAGELAELAAVHGLPQALGLRAADAELAHAAGDRERLRSGAAVDALIAYLLTLALQQATGERSAASVAADRARVRDWLATRAEPHWRAFHKAWKP